MHKYLVMYNVRMPGEVFLLYVTTKKCAHFYINALGQALNCHNFLYSCYCVMWCSGVDEGIQAKIIIYTSRHADPEHFMSLMRTKRRLEALNGYKNK